MNTEATVKALSSVGDLSLLTDGRGIGLEKESLRVTPEFTLSPNPHPKSLGSALTHPHITTDYSETLLEIVTPAMPSTEKAQAFLENTHTFVCSKIGDEALWNNSMPCIIKGKTTIPIAHYGTSNIGQMKKIYRRGLACRYGPDMQAIAGVHFNYSFGNALMDWLRDWRAPETRITQFRSQAYMGLVRNIMRISWIIPYLFGASPAVCKSFVGFASKLRHFDSGTLYGRHATSLRMGDIGYQNNQGAKMGFAASYNSLQQYISSLKQAIMTPCHKYEKLGVKNNGVFQQLNSCVLQLDNEYYATIRPKCVPKKGEMSITALHRRGVEYVELRSLDVDPFEPCGIGEAQLDFLELFMTYCLLTDDSPFLDEAAAVEIRENEVRVAHRGRDPNLFLYSQGRKKPLRVWGNEICQQMLPVSELLSKAHGNTRFSQALRTQMETFQVPERMPSARILDQMRTSGESFAVFSGSKTIESSDHFANRSLDPECHSHFCKLAAESLQAQADIESQDVLPLDEYISHYFSQLQEIQSA